ncbi:hypothetical protein [Glutamicibacter sp. 2E12]|uniref:hypothetical protein n=1 Tax=Glutamicibacter sp. 2E12 TaxID=3416181 RepID=UPI003CE69D7C
MILILHAYLINLGEGKVEQLCLRTRHESPESISERLRTALTHESQRKYAKDISLLYVSNGDFTSQYTFPGFAVSPNSAEYDFLIDNISPNLFVLEYTPQSSDRSWKLDPDRINNIKKFKNLIERISENGIPALAIVPDKYFDMAIHSGILKAFNLVISSFSKSGPQGGIILKNLNELEAISLDEKIRGFISDNDNHLRSLLR